MQNFLSLEARLLGDANALERGDRWETDRTAGIGEGAGQVDAEDVGVRGWEQSRSCSSVLAGRGSEADTA